MSLENVLERGKAKIAELLAGKQQAKESQAAEDAKKAEELNKDKEPVEPKQKSADEIQVEEQEEATEDELLDKPEDQLEEEEKTKLEEIKKKRDGEPSDKQLARKLKKAEKKISKLYGQGKDRDRAHDAKIKDLESEMIGLKDQIKKVATPIEVNNAAQAEEQRILTEITEDKDKSFAERREMTKEDWETWNDEDPLAAQRWVTKNEQRRVSLKKEADDKTEIAGKAEEFLADQNKSVERLIDKYPNTRPEAKVLELKEKGLTKDEISNVLETEYPEYALCDKIVKENPDWMNAVDFGDKVAAELEKRLADVKKEKPKPKMYSEAEVEKIKEDALKGESERRARVDESNSSTKSVPVITKPLVTKSEKLEKLEALYTKAGLDPTKAKARMEERSRLGLNNYDPTKDEDED